MSTLAYYCRGCMPLTKRGLPRRWKGPCPRCGGLWSIVTKNVSDEEMPDGLRVEPEEGEAVSLADVADSERPRIIIGEPFTMIDDVLGGGIVPGSVTLLAGPPGIGKSTLTLQLLHHMAESVPILYATGEESVKQIRSRGKRLGALHRSLAVIEQSDLVDLLDYIATTKIKFVVIDSVQTLLVDDELVPGSSTSIAMAVDLVRKFARQESVAFWAIGHVTADGSIAGPHSGLVHAVDAVLYFEGEEKSAVRRLACPEKNRFGPTGASVFAKFRMTDKGLVPWQPPIEKSSRKSKSSSV